MNTNVNDEDYLDKLTRALPWHRTFSLYDRILIVFVAAIFVSFVGCTLLCFIYSRSSLRRRYSSKANFNKKQSVSIPTAPKEDTFVYTSSPPSYESIVLTDNSTTFNNLSKIRPSELERRSIPCSISDSDVDRLSSINRKRFLSQSTRSSLSNDDATSTRTMVNNHLSPPFTQVHTKLHFDTIKNLLMIHLTNVEQIALHPAFDEHAEFFIHVQLINNKILKKFQDIHKKHWSSVQFITWKKQQEKTTKKLVRISDDKLLCDEHLQFELSKDNITSTSLRFLFFCVDRSGIQDLMFESVLCLTPSMLNEYQQIIEFKDLPQITFGEIYLGISHLPTAERLTIKVNKLRYLCKIETDEKIDAHLTAVFFHRGRRFFQKKFSPFIIDGSVTKNNNIYEINESIMQNIPQNDIQSVYVHFELVIRMLHSNKESIISCGTILLGEHTRYESDWQNILEQPRQTHLRWYQFFG
ncbi:unnamed protein product [Adineta steineri]|uniref:Uncharacterized protein n=1 Tax=Adineta steineri TaxID=433720 RepID=A0A815MYR2_9BILA|nr:unnamed protein product [Adineta steineri]CAF1420595.1 unnamed protein product [Adineta steineri]CAF1426164.1 unnamed protein product [Adineta steineri]